MKKQKSFLQFIVSFFTSLRMARVGYFVSYVVLFFFLALLNQNEEISYNSYLILYVVAIVSMAMVWSARARDIGINVTSVVIFYAVVIAWSWFERDVVFLLLLIGVPLLIIRSNRYRKNK
ncbi:MAG: hypothetical protein QM529_00475 [Hydrotalea sp.]|nr:hypothetical protein [Hydrotalea sp.]